MRYRRLLLIALFALLPGLRDVPRGVASASPAEAGGDLRKAKAYVSEVRKHLLRSYLERERMSEAKLAAAAL